MSIKITKVELVTSQEKLDGLLNPKEPQSKYASSMMKDADKLMLIKMEMPESYATMVYNPENNQNIIMSHRKYGDTSLSPESLVSHNILSSIRKDFSNAESYIFDDIHLKELGRVIRNNDKVLKNEVAITDLDISLIIYEEDFKIDLASQVIEIGTLFDDDYTHEIKENISLNDLNDFVIGAKGEVIARIQERENISEQYPLQQNSEIEQEPDWNDIPLAIHN